MKVKGFFNKNFACGLPYYVGDVIKDHKKLVLREPEDFKDTLVHGTHFKWQQMLFRVLTLTRCHPLCS